jgi:hypothetical protein
MLGLMHSCTNIRRPGPPSVFSILLDFARRMAFIHVTRTSLSARTAHQRRHTRLEVPVPCARRAGIEARSEHPDIPVQSDKLIQSSWRAAHLAGAGEYQYRALQRTVHLAAGASQTNSSDVLSSRKWVASICFDGTPKVTSKVVRPER